MPSEAFRLAEREKIGEVERFTFDKQIKARHLGGTYINSDVGRPLKKESSSGGELRLPSKGKSWGEKEWHEYALTPNGFYEGDMPRDNYTRHTEIDEWSELDSWKYNPDFGGGGPKEVEVIDDKEVMSEINHNGAINASHASKGDRVELQIKTHPSSGRICFAAEFVDYDEFVNQKKSVRIFEAKNNRLPFLEGEIVTAVIKKVEIKSLEKRTKDKRRIIVIYVDDVKFR